jgi:hypothetical protein
MATGTTPTSYTDSRNRVILHCYRAVTTQPEGPGHNNGPYHQTLPTKIFLRFIMTLTCATRPDILFSLTSLFWQEYAKTANKSVIIIICCTFYFMPCNLCSWKCATNWTNIHTWKFRSAFLIFIYPYKSVRRLHFWHFNNVFRNKDDTRDYMWQPKSSHKVK